MAKLSFMGLMKDNSPDWHLENVLHKTDERQYAELQ